MSELNELGLRNEVLRRHHQGETGRHIARQLGSSRWKVSAIIGVYARDRAAPTAAPAASPPARPSPHAIGQQWEIVWAAPPQAPAAESCLMLSRPPHG